MLYVELISSAPCGGCGGCGGCGSVKAEESVKFTIKIGGVKIIWERVSNGLCEIDFIIVYVFFIYYIKKIIYILNYCKVTV